MYTLTRFIEDVVRALPSVTLDQDISSLSSNDKKTINEELLRTTGLIDGWFVWSNDLYTYNAEANIIRKIDYSDTGSFNVPTLNQLIDKPIIFIQAVGTDNAVLHSGLDPDTNNSEWQLSTSPLFETPETTILDYHNLGITVRDLIPGSNYYVRTRQVSDTDVSEWSDMVHIVTLKVPDKLTPILSVTDVTDTSKWDTNSITNDLTTYELKDVTLRDLEPGKEYHLSGRVRNPDGSYSDKVDLKDITIEEPIVTPYILAEYINNDVYVTTTPLKTRPDYTGNVNVVEIQYGLDPNWVVYNTNTYGLSTSNQYVITNVYDGRPVYVRLRYVSFTGEASGWSNVNKIIAPLYRLVSAGTIASATLDDVNSPTELTVTTHQPILLDDTVTVVGVSMYIASTDHSFTYVHTPLENTNMYNIPVGNSASNLHQGNKYSIILWYVGYVDATGKPAVPSGINTISELMTYGVSYLNSLSLPFVVDV